jgi:DNA-binding HxlR family transcriptional regulator
MPATAKVQTAKRPARSATTAVESQSGVARRERNCSVARTLDIVSDAWAFLIIREAFFGTQTFEAFRSALGIPRATLTNRLKKLTQLAIFRQAATGASQRKEYRLTKMGFDLYPSFIALMQFGDRWLADGKPAPLTLVHVSCGCDSHPLVACSHCGKGVNARDVKYRDGSGAGRHPAKTGRNTRRASDGNRFLLGRPSSVSRALQIIGDKWSFMVVREGFFGNRRYDKILTELSIAPNILTDRLSRLVANGVLHRRQYQNSPDRYEYLLTDMGRDLYGPFIAMLGWGDRWLSKGKPPLLLKHLSCGHDFRAEVVCDRCKQPIVAADMRYKLAYDPKSFGALGPRSVS